MPFFSFLFPRRRPRPQPPTPPDIVTEVDRLISRAHALLASDVVLLAYIRAGALAGGVFIPTSHGGRWRPYNHRHPPPMDFAIGALRSPSPHGYADAATSPRSTPFEVVRWERLEGFPLRGEEVPIREVMGNAPPLYLFEEDEDADDEVEQEYVRVYHDDDNYRSEGSPEGSFVII